MIFIFGYHPKTKTVGPVEDKTCPNCNNTRHWLLGKTTDFISFFFIPLIPTKTKYHEHCPVCNFTNELSRSEFERKKDLADLNSEAVNGDMSDAEYEKRLQNLSK